MQGLTTGRMQIAHVEYLLIIGTDCVEGATIGSIDELIVDKQLVRKCHSTAFQCLLNLSEQLSVNSQLQR